MAFRYTDTRYSINQGEVGTTLSGQKQLRASFGGAQVVDNCDLNEVGNIIKRNGFKFCIQAPATDYSLNYRVIDFCVHVGQVDAYRVAIFSENKVTIYKVDTEDDVNPGALTKLCEKDTAYTAAVLSQCNCTQFATCSDSMGNGIIFAHRNLKPFALTWRGNASTADDFAIGELALTNIPCAEMVQNDKTGTELGTGTLTLSNTNGEVKLVAQNAVFTGEYKGKHVHIANNGTFRVLEKEDNKTLLLYAENGGIPRDNIPAANLTIEMGYEPIASQTYGWFDCVCFYHNRLFFGGTAKQPNVIIGSMTERIFDFDVGRCDETDGLHTYLPTSGGESITNLSIGSGLHVYTNNGVYVTSADELTPQLFTFTRITSETGCDAYSDAPQTSTGGKIHIDSKNRMVYYTSYAKDRRSYMTEKVSSIQPSDEIRQSESTFSVKILNAEATHGESLCFINDENRMVRILLSLETEIGASFSRYTFDDRIQLLNLVSVYHYLYAIIGIVGSSNAIVARMDEEALLDCETTVDLDEAGEAVLPESYPSALGSTLYYIDEDADENWFGYTIVYRNRTIRLGESRADHTLRLGYPFFAYIETMEMEGGINEVPHTLMQPKLIAGVHTNVKEASNLYVGVAENTPTGITNCKFQKLVDVPPDDPKESVPARRGFFGWKRKPILIFKQKKPGHLYIYNYAADVLLGGK